MVMVTDWNVRPSRMLSFGSAGDGLGGTVLQAGQRWWVGVEVEVEVKVERVTMRSSVGWIELS